MSFYSTNLRKLVLGATFGFVTTLPAFAGDIVIHDAYARSSTPFAQSGAVFMEIMNKGETDDRLISAETEVSKKAELHTHIQNDDGVMKMRRVEEGFAIPAGGMHMLQRGGDHVMMMGLLQSLEHGQTITLRLVFEEAGELSVEVPVDLERKPVMQHGAKMGGNSDQ